MLTCPRVLTPAFDSLCEFCEKDFEKKSFVSMCLWLDQFLSVECNKIDQHCADKREMVDNLIRAKIAKFSRDNSANEK